MHPGEFYALPQSPQIFKQILMIAGFDRYVQIARCFRDEDAARRSPARVHAGGPRDVVRHAADSCSRSSKARWPRASSEIGVDIPRPFRRMPYAEAMAKCGSDKPDLRFGLEIQDFGPLFAQSPFGIFREAVDARRHDPRLRDPGAAKYSRTRSRRARRAGEAARAPPA